jgi:hypothetical protein
VTPKFLVLCDLLRVTTFALAFTSALTLPLATLPFSVSFPVSFALSVTLTTFTISVSLSFTTFAITVALTVSITLTRLVAIIFLFGQGQQGRIQIRFESSRSFGGFLILSPCRQAEPNSDYHYTGTNQSQLSVHRSFSFVGHQEFRGVGTPRMETSLVSCD